jgi:hypothetical protein
VGVPVTVATRGRPGEAARPAGPAGRRTTLGRPRRDDTPGSELELLILSVDRDHVGAVDLASGALVRAWAPAGVDPRLRPYDVVAGTIGADRDGAPDPAEPEAVVMAGGLEPVGRLRGRPVERYLRPLCHPKDQPLLGCHAPAIPFWERRADHPSIAVVEPEAPAVVTRGRDRLLCWFGWKGALVHLPFLDLRVSTAMARNGRARIRTRRGDRLVVALTPPIAGHCHKVVAGVLPRP